MCSDANCLAHPSSEPVAVFVLDLDANEVDRATTITWSKSELSNSLTKYFQTFAT